MLAGLAGHSPHLVTSGHDCSWITTEEECKKVTSEVHHMYLGAEDYPEAPRGCITFEYAGVRCSVFNSNENDTPCGETVEQNGVSAKVDCVCKGAGMTALPLGDPNMG